MVPDRARRLQCVHSIRLVSSVAIMQCFRRCALMLLAIVAIAAIGAIVLGRGALAWLSAADAPEPAEAIIVLGGDASRALTAADLYQAGFARQIFLTNERRERRDAALDAAHVPFPRTEETSRVALKLRGVPGDAVRTIDRDVVSTAAEAALYAEIFRERAPRLLVVTSAYHVRRARMIFRAALPHADIRVIANRYETFPREWWRDQEAARFVLLEVAKIVFYELGGRF